MQKAIRALGRVMVLSIIDVDIFWIIFDPPPHLLERGTMDEER